MRQQSLQSHIQWLCHSSSLPLLLLLRRSLSKLLLLLWTRLLMVLLLFRGRLLMVLLLIVLLRMVIWFSLSLLSSISASVAFLL